MIAGMSAASTAAFGQSAPATSQVAGQSPRFVISDFGAVADGKTLNTQVIQRVIDHAASNGGGTVVVPAGTFLSGAIFLKPGVGLYVEKAGVLKGSTDISDYPQRLTRIEGHFQQWVPALVNADGIDHLQIGGPGTLDGSGMPFYAAFWDKFHADKSTKNLDVPRPRLIYISNCSDARVEGLRLLNSGFWNLHVYHCDHSVIDGLDINAPVTSPSTDGVDIDSSQWITIQGCRIRNNDDGICLKGAKGPTAMENADSPPDEHIHISDCEFDHSGSFVTCGSEATIVRDVEVDHCRAIGTGPHAMMRLKLRTDTPQLYENIRFHDITLQGGGSIIEIAPWSQYHDLRGHAPPTHTVRNISLSNISGSFGSLGSVKTNPGDVIQDMTLENIDVGLVKTPAPLGKIDGLKLTGVRVNGEAYNEDSR
jgi:alpha-L-rhamnosidase